MRRIAALVVVAIVCSGCASLLTQPEDSTGTKAWKLSARVLIGLSTVGLSQVVMARHEENERKARRREWRRKWREAVEGARTLSEITVVFNGLPVQCLPSGPDEQICEWNRGKKTTVYYSRTNPQAFGTGTRTVTRPITSGTVVRAVCTLWSCPGSVDSQPLSVFPS